jgi:spore coat protein U-like protein
MRLGAVLMVGAAWLLSAGAAAASSTTTIVGDPQTLTVDVTGQVAGRCGFSTPPTDKSVLGDLATAGSLTLNFTVDCNTPFRVRAISTNGGLKTTSATGEGFTNLLDYSLRLQLATDAGGLDATCNADALASAAGGCAYYGSAAGQGLSSGQGVSLNASGALQFGWTAAPQRLVAGSYSDTLTIVVEARS